MRLSWCWLPACMPSARLAVLDTHLQEYDPRRMTHACNHASQNPAHRGGAEHARTHIPTHTAKGDAADAMMARIAAESLDEGQRQTATATATATESLPESELQYEREPQFWIFSASPCAWWCGALPPNDHLHLHARVAGYLTLGEFIYDRYSKPACSPMVPHLLRFIALVCLQLPVFCYLISQFSSIAIEIATYTGGGHW